MPTSRARSFLSFARRIARRGALLCAAALLIPAAAAAQATDEVYGGDDVEVQPRVAAPAQISRLVVAAVPTYLKGQAGRVHLEVVVDKEGRVEPESVKVLEASNQDLGKALAKAAPRMAFQPGQKGGQPVRTRVRIPFEIAG